MTQLTNILLAAIVVLLLFNVYQTNHIARQLAEAPTTDVNGQGVDPQAARELGNRVAALYNSQNHEQLYALFHPQAKVKISAQQIERQLTNLFTLFGRIEESALLNSIKLGEKAGEVYYQLRYRARVSKTEHQRASMTLSVIQTTDNFQLYGFRLNAQQSLD